MVESVERLVPRKGAQLVLSHVPRLGPLVVLMGVGCHGAGTKPDLRCLSPKQLSARAEAEATEEVESFLSCSCAISKE